MSLLEPLDTIDACELHRLAGQRPGIRDRLVVSTPETRAICNQPEIVGVDYTNRLRTAVTRTLRGLQRTGLLPDVPGEQHAVLHILRGGLNFGIREALHEALGFDRARAAFLSSQRFEEGGAWQVREDTYRKLNVPDGAVLHCGDVVATGVTLRHGFETLLDHLEATGTGLRGIVFYTIGGEQTEALLEELAPRLQALDVSYEGATVVYFEARFRLADEDTPMRVALPGTDLLRTEALLAPAFAASQWDAVTHPLERCSIYDAGSRAFDVPAYLEDVREYWRQVAGFAASGWTLAEALAERWPAWDQADWAVPGGHPLDSADALAAVAIERLDRLR